jgi:hypothetical protein
MQAGGLEKKTITINCKTMGEIIGASSIVLLLIISPRYSMPH